ncbi:hypothetical protein [Spirochaeta dissipatitropha]
MIYRYDKSRNPRLLTLKLGLLVLGAAASVVVFTAQPIVSIPVFIVAAFLILKVHRVYRDMIDSYFNVHDEGISGRTPSGKMVRMSYDSMSDAGILNSSGDTRVAFFYDSDADQLIQLPDLYINFNAMLEEISQYRSLPEVILEDGESLEEMLRKKFPDDESSADDESSTEEAELDL